MTDSDPDMYDVEMSQAAANTAGGTTSDGGFDWNKGWRILGGLFEGLGKESGGGVGQPTPPPQKKNYTPVIIGVLGLGFLIVLVVLLTRK